MVGGLDRFRESFAQFSDNFVIIGGTACDEVLSRTEMHPRATMEISLKPLRRRGQAITASITF